MPSKAFAFNRRALRLGRKTVVMTVWMVGTVVALSPHSPIALVQGAEAAAGKQFFTRKRVNGRWITGKFAAGAAIRRPQKYASLPRSPAVEDEPQAPLPPPRPRIGAPAPSAADRVIATASVTPAPAEPRMEVMRPALEARARSLAGDTFALPLPEPPPPLSEMLARR